MTYKTYAQLKTLIEQELDLEQETFVQSAELLDYFNRAIKEAEASIHTLGLGAKYFQTRAYLTLTNGSNDITLPSNIYETKIIDVVYDNGSIIFEIKPIKNPNKLFNKRIISQYTGNPPEYFYDLRNDSAAAGIVMEVFPAATETSSTHVYMEYIREANVLVSTTDKCDIPEFYTFILAYVRWKVRDKEGHPDSENAKNDYERERLLMVETLESKIDNSSEVPRDVSIYEEMS